VVAYFDASAFLKIVIVEPGSQAAHDTWLAASRRVSSRLLYPEARAGLARARRMERIDVRALDYARDTIEEYVTDVDLLEVTPSIARRAGDLAEEHGLRAYDAVHLATLDAVADDDTVLVSTDGDLVRAARSHGLAAAAL